MQRTRGFHKIAYIFLIVTLVACATIDPYTGEKKASKMAIGAGIGALAGAGVGLIAGGDTEGALIGAGIGVLAGGAVGAYMDKQEAELREQLQGTGVSVTRSGDNLILNMPGDITFDVNRYDIKQDFYDVLNSVVLVLNKYEKTSIHVTGFTDSTGPYQYNMRLSERRAEAVASYLRSQKIIPARIFTQGKGPDYPIASNDTPDGRALNRRVELTLVPHTG